jgi:ApaG protein
MLSRPPPRDVRSRLTRWQTRSAPGFGRQKNSSSQEAAEQVDNALRALRMLSEQTHLLDCTSESVTEGVRVEITSVFLQRVHPQGYGRALFQFTYRARIENVGKHTVKVLGRSWQIHNDTNMYNSVPRGSKGVVGCTPILKPGDCFEYHSGADLDTMRGFMKGSFQMAVLDENDRAERRFDAIVAPFNLIGNAHQVLHTSDEDDDNDEGQDWDSDQR